MVTALLCLLCLLWVASCPVARPEAISDAQQACHAFPCPSPVSGVAEASRAVPRMAEAETCSW